MADRRINLHLGIELFAAIIWNQAESSPNTPLAVILETEPGSTFNFTVQPIFPSAGGTAPDAQTVSMTFTCVTTPTLA